MIIDMQFGIAISGVQTALLELPDIRRGQHSSRRRSMTLMMVFTTTS